MKKRAFESHKVLKCYAIPALVLCTSMYGCEPVRGVYESTPEAGHLRGQVIIRSFVVWTYSFCPNYVQRHENGSHRLASDLSFSASAVFVCIDLCLSMCSLFVSYNTGAGTQHGYRDTPFSHRLD